MSDEPIHAYRRRVRAGEIKPDGAQELAAEKLQALHHVLRDYRPAGGRANWKERLGLARRRADPPQGLYLYGPVGRGKSMLMDLFFETAPVERKRRVHFHAFMGEVHEKLHRWREQTRGSKADPLPDLAAELAEEAWLLCFDEFVVINIADAMILARLFESLFDRGVVVVATSNFEPDRLYEGGLQREHFLPFIELLKQRLDVLDLGKGTDYRLDRLKQQPVFHHPLGPEANRFAEAAFVALTEGAAVARSSITVKGRKIPVPAAAAGVARFTFAELCEQPLGASDYLALATHFRALVLEEVPVMEPAQRNEARRFMHLIDALYEHRCKLVMTAAAPPEALYPEGDGSYEFTRTVSRLAEMQAADYLERPHLP